MADLKEQRVCIRFCFLLAKTAAETVTMLREAFKKEALSQARVYEWFSWVQTWWHVTWRPTAIWASFNKQNRRKHSKNSRCDIVWSSSNNRRVGSIDWSFVELMSTNFNRRTPRNVAVRWVASASRQCSRPHSNECAAVSQEKRDDNGFAPPTPRTGHPAIFFLFPGMKRDLEGKRSQNVEEVREKTTEALKANTLQRVPELFWMEKAVG